MKRFKLIILFCLILLSTGCWNYRELNELSIIEGLGIDIDEDYYSVSVAVTNPKKVASNTESGGSISNETPTIVYEAKAKTIGEAINKLSFVTPSQIYVGHMKLLVLSDEVTRKGINNIIDYLSSSIESRKIFSIAVVRNGKAIDLLKTILPYRIITSQNIKSMLENINKTRGTLSNRLFDEIINCIYMEGRHAVISALDIIGDKNKGQDVDNISSTIPSASVKIIGSAVLKKDKLVGYLEDKDSLGYTLLRDTVTTMEYSFPCDNKNNYGDTVIDNVKVDVKVKVKNNIPKAYISVQGKAALPEYNCKTDLTKEKNIKKINKMINDELKNIIDNSIKNTQKLKSDVFGFGERLYKENNRYWKKVDDNWDEIFSKMNYKISSKIKLSNVESTTQVPKGVKHNGK